MRPARTPRPLHPWPFAFWVRKIAGTDDSPCERTAMESSTARGTSPHFPPGSPANGQDAIPGSKHLQRRSFLDYRRFIQHHYDGLAGKLTAVTGLVTGHEALAGRLIRPSA